LTKRGEASELKAKAAAGRITRHEPDEDVQGNPAW